MWAKSHQFRLGSSFITFMGCRIAFINVRLISILDENVRHRIDLEHNIELKLSSSYLFQNLKANLSGTGVKASSCGGRKYVRLKNSTKMNTE